MMRKAAAAAHAAAAAAAAQTWRIVAQIRSKCHVVGCDPGATIAGFGDSCQTWHDRQPYIRLDAIRDVTIYSEQASSWAHCKLVGLVRARDGGVGPRCRSMRAINLYALVVHRAQICP